MRDQGNGAEAALSSSEMIACPSCGRTIERVPVCYYCCASTEPSRRITERRLILCAVAVLFIGVVTLGLSALSETEVTPIAQLDNMPSFQTYRIQGRVTDTRTRKTPYPDVVHFTFTVRDSSSPLSSKNSIKVKVEGPVYSELKRKGLLPRKGDRVDLVASLYAGKGWRLMGLNASTMIRILERGRGP